MAKQEKKQPKSRAKTKAKTANPERAIKAFRSYDNERTGEIVRGIARMFVKPEFPQGREEDVKRALGNFFNRHDLFDEDTNDNASRKIQKSILDDFVRGSSANARFFAGVGIGRPEDAVDRAVRMSGWKKDQWTLKNLYVYYELNFIKYCEDFSGSQKSRRRTDYEITKTCDRVDNRIDHHLDIWGSHSGMDPRFGNHPSLKKGMVYVLLLFGAVPKPEALRRFYRDSAASRTASDCEQQMDPEARQRHVDLMGLKNVDKVEW